MFFLFFFQQVVTKTDWQCWGRSSHDGLSNPSEIIYFQSSWDDFQVFSFFLIKRKITNILFEFCSSWSRISSFSIFFFIYVPSFIFFFLIWAMIDWLILRVSLLSSLYLCLEPRLRDNPSNLCSHHCLYFFSHDSHEKYSFRLWVNVLLIYS